jgi:hypothetical protein
MNNDFGIPNANENFVTLSDDEVLFVRAGRVLMSNPTFKVSEFLDALAQLVSDQEEEWTEEQEGWFGDRGARCEVLRFGNQGWQRGRVRIRLEFCPEPPPKLLRESRTPGEEINRRMAIALGEDQDAVLAEMICIAAILSSGAPISPFILKLIKIIKSTHPDWT